MKFYKYEGLGNDFILIEDFDSKAPKDKKFTRNLCNRHFGIGADGILYLQKSKAGYFMKLINSDGTEAEMCGNGIRCIAKHLHDFGFVKTKKFMINTKAGLKKLEVKLKSAKVSEVTVDVGPPEFLGVANLLGETLHLVSMGNPHAVILKNKIDLEEVNEKGRKLESHNYFPNRTNVEFVKVKSKNQLEAVVYERGVGLTLACGTGACASAAIAVKLGIVRINHWVGVKLPGGFLRIKISPSYSSILMSGPANLVFKGEI
ncbi:diaminopimelate epimerase [Candidatus Micrarchaeota archaeon]|nr:diaminopimelate epimerase [Candidatus Micrarchaeota archaeon]